jgi:hypothetical protein
VISWETFSPLRQGYVFHAEIFGNVRLIAGSHWYLSGTYAQQAKRSEFAVLVTRCRALGFGGRTRARTWDPLIKSQLLFRSSPAAAARRGDDAQQIGRHVQLEGEDHSMIGSAENKP